MADRFERLYELPNNLYTTGSPLIVSGGALLKDKESGSVLVQLKFQSVSSVTIKAVSVDISAFDVTGQKLAGQNNYQYLDLFAHEGDFFGSKKAIIMPDATTRSFEITKICVVFDDGAIANVLPPLTSLPKETSLINTLREYELVNLYRKMTCDKASFVPIEEKGIWQCTCGKWNNGSVCTHCHTWKQEVFSTFDIDFLRKHSPSHSLIEPEVKKDLYKSTKSARYFLIAAKIFCVLALLWETLLMFVRSDESFIAVLCSSGLCAVSFLLLLFGIGKNAPLTQITFLGLAIGEMIYSQVAGDLAPFICNAIIWGLLFLASMKRFSAKLIGLMPLAMLMSFIKPLWISYLVDDFWAFLAFGISSVVMSLICGWLFFSTKSNQNNI